MLRSAILVLLHDRHLYHATYIWPWCLLTNRHQRLSLQYTPDAVTSHGLGRRHHRHPHLLDMFGQADQPESLDHGTIRHSVSPPLHYILPTV